MGAATDASTRTGGGTVRLAELLAAVSLATDLADDAPFESALGDPHLARARPAPMRAGTAGSSSTFEPDAVSRNRYAGGMFWLKRNTLPGSKRALSACSRANFADP